MDILNNEGTVVDGATAGLIAAGNDQSSAAVYEYSVWANPGEQLTCVPRDLRYVYFVVACDTDTPNPYHCSL